MPVRFLSTAGSEASSDSPAGRGWTRFGVARVTPRDTPQAASGISAIAAMAARQSETVSTRLAVPSAAA